MLLNPPRPATHRFTEECAHERHDPSSVPESVGDHLNRSGNLARPRPRPRVRPETRADLPVLESLRPRLRRRAAPSGGGLQQAGELHRSAGADPFLYEHLHANLDDLVDKLGKQFGGWYPFAAEMNQTKSGWKGVPWFWVSFPGTYNQAHFKKAGFENPPKTWAELLSMGKALKKQGNPVGIPISHCSDAHSTYWSVAWSFGAKVLEADGKTPAINSDKTAHVLDWYKELYAEAMEPEVLSWDDAGNNRFLLSGKGSWIHNPVSPYNAALKEKMPIADDINHHNSPAGPAGAHSAPPILGMAVWKFSKNVELAKEFIQFLFKKENYDAWIVASNAFNHPPLRHLADHPIWAKNPKFAMLPKEAEYAHPRGWPAKPSDAA